MTEKFQAIVLSAVRHSDRASIVSTYTPTHGRLPLIVNTGSGRGARMRAPHIMPLAQIEFSCRYHQTRELQRPASIAPVYTYRDLYFNPVKNAIGIFLAEFLNRLMRDTTPDQHTFRFIADSLKVLDILPGFPANFHITFLTQLATFMGIAPDLSTHRPGAVFDMRAGRYSSMHPGHPDILTGSEAKVPLLLSRLAYANMHRQRHSRDQRAAILRGMLRYWGIHYPGVASLRSPDILAELFE